MSDEKVPVRKVEDVVDERDTNKMANPHGDSEKADKDATIAAAGADATAGNTVNPEKVAQHGGDGWDAVPVQMRGDSADERGKDGKKK